MSIPHPTSRIPYPQTYTPTDPYELHSLSILSEDPLSEPWSLVKEDQTFKIYARKQQVVDDTCPESAIMRIEVDFPYSSSLIFKALSDFTWRKSWESMCKEGEIIREYPNIDNLSIRDIYYYLKMPIIFSDREFVVKSKMWKDHAGLKGHYLICEESIEDEKYPIKSKPVRGLFYNKSCYFYPINEGHCRYTGIGHIQMKMYFGGLGMFSKGAEGQKKWLDSFKENIKEYK